MTSESGGPGTQQWKYGGIIRICTSYLCGQHTNFTCFCQAWASPDKKRVPLSIIALFRDICGPHIGDTCPMHRTNGTVMRSGLPALQPLWQ